jgi:transposase
MAAYSQDLRDRVLRALDRGERPTDIARRLEVSRVWVYQVRNRLKREGSRQSLPLGGYRKPRLAVVEQTVRGWIREKPDLILADIRERLLARHKISITIAALWYQLDRWGLTFKKNSARRRARASGRSARPR